MGTPFLILLIIAVAVYLIENLTINMVYKMLMKTVFRNSGSDEQPPLGEILD